MQYRRLHLRADHGRVGLELAPRSTSLRPLDVSARRPHHHRRFPCHGLLDCCSSCAPWFSRVLSCSQRWMADDLWFPAVWMADELCLASPPPIQLGGEISEREPDHIDCILPRARQHGSVARRQCHTGKQDLTALRASGSRRRGGRGSRTRERGAPNSSLTQG